MYAWKCWRDSRLRFVAYLTVVVAIPINPALAPAFRYGETGWVLVRDSSAKYVAALSHGALGAVGGLGLFLIALAGMVLGATGVGEEFKLGSLEFLLTRPRRRRHFIWVSWGVGVLEMLAMLFLLALAVFVPVYYLSRGMALWRLFALTPLLLVAAMVFFGLSYLGTVLTRDERSGMALAVIAALAYGIASYFLEMKWRIKLPSLIDVLRPVVDRDRPFAYGLVAAWTAFALGCPLLAQWVFERKDV